MDGATQPAHYGRIMFDVSTTATDVPEVGLRCYRAPNGSSTRTSATSRATCLKQWFTLDSNYRVDGVAATCYARLFYFDRRGREIVLQTMSSRSRRRRAVAGSLEEGGREAALSPLANA